MEFSELERVVAAMHAAHYTPENPNGLWHPDESPNANTIYKVWNDGEITEEKGGHAFGDRSKRSVAQPLVTGMDFLPTFPLKTDDWPSYAILTMDECYTIRGMLKELLAPHIIRHAEVRVRTDSQEVVRTIRSSFHTHRVFIDHQSPVLVNPFVFVVQGRGDLEQKIQTCLSGMDADIFVY
jgi:hypothetical protein